MLVDINLLQVKEKRQRPLLIVLLCIALLFVIFTVLLLINVQKEKKHNLALTNEIQEISLQVEEKEKMLDELQYGSSAASLESAVTWAKDEQLETVPILEQLIKLLPERGFLKEYTYETQNNIVMTVQFDTSRQAAYYLHELTNADWIIEASLQSIKVPEEAEEVVEATNKEVTPPILPRYEAIYNLSINKAKFQREEDEIQTGGDS
ncbi:PilN domain-containing protein [Lederbergia citrea]|uniref:Fimbrial assembly protein n=1 Tax=Lederbergia citrea TaxID=2833581 RepID=A0A942Z4M6_9BACI|nr:hypothetical protein [Lederbergia citrea]MBS4176190.1 hypothetical protein [Lederbergia citrea]MBS4222582.1 hypothetical protein [Lederbergia citrea]